MLDLIRSDPEGPDLKALAIHERPSRRGQGHPTGEELRLAEDACGDWPHGQRQLRRRVRNEAAMVPVQVRDHDAEQARVVAPQTWHIREGSLALLGVERHPEIEEDALALRLKFDAGSANLGGPAVNANT